MHEIILVLTKIDELKNFNKDEKDDLSKEDQIFLQAAEDRLVAVQKKVEEAQRKKEAARGHGKEFERCDDEVKQLDKLEKDAESQLQQAHLQIRCSELRREAEDLLQGVENSKYAPKLRVFPVSNPQYQELISGSKERPSLDAEAEATGIPGLRRELLRISSGGKLNTLQHLCTRQLPWIFAGIDGILTKTPTERTGQLRRVLDAMIRQESRMFRDMKQELLKAYDDTVSSTISENRRSWAERCKTMIKTEWSGINGSTLAGILRRAGKWNHKKLGKQNWSKDIHAIFLSQKKLSRAFDDFTDIYLALIAKAFNMRLKDKLDALRNELTEGKYSKGLRMAPFSQFIMGTYADVERTMNQQFDKLEAEIESIRHSITVEPDNENYNQQQTANGEKHQHILGQAMKQTYEDAKGLDSRQNGLKGKRMKRARLAVVEAKLTSSDKEENLFQCIGKMGRDRLEAFFDEWMETSREIVDKGFAKIQKNFDNRFRERVAIKTEDQPEAEEKLRRMVVEAESVINGRLKELINTCEEFEKADNKV